ncbi:MAG TPA: hypothetical protein VHK88_03060, partial [Aquihabitans sp.]|nr:hypothetical protein [Aquihabitans sp.]
MTASGRGRFRAVLGGVVTLLLFLAVTGPLRRSLAPVAVDAGDGEVGEVVAARELSDVGTTAPAAFEGPARLPDDDPDGTRTNRTWFAAGQWWAILDAGGSAGGAAHIWRLTGEAGPWEDTGVLVDDRPFAEPWVAWTGSELVVASTGSRTYRSHGLQVNRFTWDAARRNWVRSADFPVRVTQAGAPGTQLVVDREGRAWLARQEGAGVLVASSDADKLSFGPFAPLPDGQAAADVGSFSLTLGDAGPQIAWRSATTDQLAVTSHRDGAWSTERVVAHGVGGSGVVQAAPAGPSRPGALLVVVASSLPQRGSNDQDPSVLLL